MTQRELKELIKSYSRYGKATALHSEWNGDGNGKHYKIGGTIVDTRNRPDLEEIIHKRCVVKWQRW